MWTWVDLRTRAELTSLASRNLRSPEWWSGSVSSDPLHESCACSLTNYSVVCPFLLQPQQQYILLNHLEWVKWAAADEAVAAYKATLAANSSPTRAITPPSDERFARSMPQVTPARYVASSNAAAANAGTPPGQPRKVRRSLPSRGVSS